MGSIAHFHVHAPPPAAVEPYLAGIREQWHIPRRIDRRSDAISHRVEFRVSMFDTPTMKDRSIGHAISIFPLDMGSFAQIRPTTEDTEHTEVRRYLAPGSPRVAQSSLLCVLCVLCGDPFSPLDMGCIAQICAAPLGRPTSAGMPGECRVVPTGRPRPFSHLRGIL